VPDVPTIYQNQAWTVYQAKREALAQIAKDSKAMAVYLLDL
jgi:hypothetical protein